MAPAVKGEEAGKVVKEAQDYFMVTVRLSFPS